MRNHIVLLIAGLLIGSAANSQSGAMDTTFNASDLGFWSGTGTTGEIRAIAVQPDGKVLIGVGGMYNRVDCDHLARLHPNGILDTTFHSVPGLDGPVDCIVVRSDGKILVGGSFTSYDGISRNGIARLNADGSLDTGFDPGTGVSHWIEAMALQPDGKIIIGGYFDSFNGVPRNNIARLNDDGTLDMSFDPGTGPSSTTLTIALQPDGKALIGGWFYSYNGTPRPKIARVNADGSLDLGFDPGTGADDDVECLTLQPDGKILIGGRFTTYNDTACGHIARVGPTGILDPTFDPGDGANDDVYCMLLQPDGKILVGGRFTDFDWSDRGYVARLENTGAVDMGFTLDLVLDLSVNTACLQADGKILVGGGFDSFQITGPHNLGRLHADGAWDIGFNPMTGADEMVYSIAVQPDGKILIGGAFVTYNSVARKRIARLNADGSLDTGFDPGEGFTGWYMSVQAMHVLPNGRILVGGYFTMYDGTSRKRIARLNSNGSLDFGFDPGTGADASVRDLAVQADGKIVIVGSFANFDGTPRNRIARLNTSGRLDTSFDPGAGPDQGISCVEIQPDGKILIAGDFTAYDGIARNRIARLNADGSLDMSFDPGSGADDVVRCFALQADGKILIGGAFTTYNGAGRLHIALLLANGGLDPSFDPGGGTDYDVEDIEILTDGSVLISGSFSTYDGSARGGIAHVNVDGSLVADLAGAGTADWVVAMARQADSKILIGGWFGSYDGVGRNCIARLHPIGPTTGMAEVEQNTFVLYPNPTGSRITLSLPASAEGRHVALLDVAGRQLRYERVTGSMHTIDLGGLDKGSYFLQVGFADGTVATEQVVKE